MQGQWSTAVVERVVDRAPRPPRGPFTPYAFAVVTDPPSPTPPSVYVRLCDVRPSLASLRLSLRPGDELRLRTSPPREGRLAATALRPAVLASASRDDVSTRWDGAAAALEGLEAEATAQLREWPAAAGEVLRGLVRSRGAPGAARALHVACALVGPAAAGAAQAHARAVRDAVLEILAPDGPIASSGPEWVDSMREDLEEARSVLSRFIPEVDALMAPILRSSRSPEAPRSAGPVPGLVPSPRELVGPDALCSPASLRALPALGPRAQPLESALQWRRTCYELWRSDCFLGLSQGLCALLSGRDAGCGDDEGLAVFDDVSLATEPRGADLVHRVRCRPVRPDRAGSLLYGNLVAVSLDGTFGDVVWATVASSSPPEPRGRRGRRSGSAVEFDVQFCAQANSAADEARAIAALSAGCAPARIAENPVFFMAYAASLAALRGLVVAQPALRFEAELVRCRPDDWAPADADELEVLLGTDAELRGLDPQQRATWAHFARSRVALVQGPPGTGKSHVGTRVALALARRARAASRKLLVVSHKNRSLDELLAGLAGLAREAGEDARIVRLGNSAKRSAELEAFAAERRLAEAREQRAVPQAISSSLSSAIERHGAARDRVLAAARQLHGRPLLARDEWHALGGCDAGDDEYARWSAPALARIEAELLARAEDAESAPQDSSAPGDDQQEAQHEQLLERLEFSRYEDGAADDQREHAFHAAGLARAVAPLAGTEDPPGALCAGLPLDADGAVAVLRRALLRKYRGLSALLEEALREWRVARDDLEVARSAYRAAALDAVATVVGCTATGAAVFHDALLALSPAYLVVEEAAEIPEPLLAVAASIPSLERIVMIGDHQQLRASVSSYALRRDKGLDVSAFERLVCGGLPYVALNRQSRMADELLLPVRLHYPALESNAEATARLPFPPRWLAEPLFWWDHRSPEASEAAGAARSHCNALEAERAARLAGLLVDVGYRPADVAVLTPYVGQLALLRRLCASGAARGVRLSTVDDFQGDEAMVVVLSLVRSNARRDVGFMRERNRLVVATSRHKVALVVVGDSATFSADASWAQLVREMAARGLVGERLRLVCPVHGTEYALGSAPLSLCCRGEGAPASQRAEACGEGHSAGADAMRQPAALPEDVPDNWEDAADC
eukprot:m51a1_g7490 hypothetical protein (1148) ;mRNA; f:246635-250538